MTTKTVQPKSQRPNPKPYQKPALIKGPLLANIAAQAPPVSVVCWVARAAFGEADIRWMIFRAWLLDDAPTWFRRLYLRHGETFGTWLVGRNRTRAVLRQLMMSAIRRKLKG
jgi:hypothetical protein